jgi:serine/threonine-protein kinase
VFVATDTRLGRRVVVKVLSPDLVASVSAERFEREIRLAARLQHPHIVPLLSAGDVAGVPYYTMPFVEGASLRDRLGVGPLAYAEAQSIGPLLDHPRLGPLVRRLTLWATRPPNAVRPRVTA